MASASKKATVSLSKEETERFINYYASHENLWNVTSTGYSKRDLRQAAYVSIANLMGNGMTADQVPTKVSALRTYYNKELRKENLSKRSGAGTTDVYVSTWEWFKMLDPFLRSQVHQKSTITNLDDSQLFTAETDTFDMTEETTEIGAGGDSVTFIASPPTSQATVNPEHSVSKKGRKQDNLQTQVLQTLRSIEQRRSEKENDSEALYGKYIASELTKITDFRKRREAKLRIQQIIFEYQF